MGFEMISLFEVYFLMTVFHSSRFPAAPNSTSPVDFIANVGWGAIKTLSSMDEFRNLDRDIENNSKRWRKFIEGESPEKDKFPQVKFSRYFIYKNQAPGKK